MTDGKKMPPLGLLASVAASMIIAVGGVLLVREFVPADWLRANNEVAGNYLQTLGTIFAVLLAFVVFVVWQQHNDARSAIEAEANELSDLDRTMQAFPENVRTPFRTWTIAYQRAVVGEEWTAMAKGRVSARAEQALEEIWRALDAIQPCTVREQVLYGEALARFNDLSDARVHRLHFAHLRLPPNLWVLMLTNGGLVVGSMWLFGLESLGAHVLMTAALTGSIAFILYLIADLDNPFWGAWQVTTVPFDHALDRRTSHDRQPGSG